MYKKQDDLLAHLDIHYGFSVNGVAALHTEILKESELNNFYKIYPEKFNNKTNGITFRRWLIHCNPLLTEFLDETIGDGYRQDADELERLLDYQEDDRALERLLAIKQENKTALAAYLKETQGVEIRPDSIFDIQAKRLHEYKRQQLNALYIIDKYLEIKSGKIPPAPVTAIFGAKAAPAYVIAKDIIHLILCLQEIINNDPEVSPWLKVIMVENYNVTKAEKLIPACDISEQISLASKEASGTGNMKFMMNGALTVGTLDGANVEMHDLLGDENMFLFGLRADEVEQLKREGYVPQRLYNRDPVLHRCLDALRTGFRDGVRYDDLYQRLLFGAGGSPADEYFLLADFQAYCQAEKRMAETYRDQTAWNRMSLHNIARSGVFAADRAVAEYADNIWHVPHK